MSPGSRIGSDAAGTSSRLRSTSDDDIGLRDILLGMKRCVGGHADLNDLDASRGPCFDERPSRVTTQIVAKQKRADRPLARSGMRDQPLGIDRLAQAHNAMGYVECADSALDSIA